MSEDSEESLPLPPLEAFEKLLGYHFKKKSIVFQALTHSSFANEHEGKNLRHNESLEFLGDAVLGFLVSARIFRHFPQSTEGELSKIKAYLVSAVNLAKLAESIRLGEFIRLGRGEEKTGGREKRAIIVDAYEAIIGAVYLDGGIEAADEFLGRQLEAFLENLNIQQLTYGDFKSALQEHLHDLGYPEPVYTVVNETGPDHRKIFVVRVTVKGEVIAESSGKSKKEAQQSAAHLALERLKDGLRPDTTGGEISRPAKKSRERVFS